MFGIFGSKHVKEAIKAVQDIQNQNSDILASGHVAQRVITTLKNSKDKTEASITQDGLSYKGLAYLVMSNVIFQELSSGQHHIYRGSLNMTGQNMRQLWNRISSELIQEKLSTQQDIDRETADLDSNIRECG